MPREPDSQYPLQAILRQRRIEKDRQARSVARRESEVSRLESRKEETEQEVQAERERLEHLQQERTRRLEGDVRSDEIRMVLDSEEKARKGLDQALKRCDDARRRLDGSLEKLRLAREELAGAMGRLKAVERHRDEWEREERRGAEDRREEDP